MVAGTESNTELSQHDGASTGTVFGWSLALALLVVLFVEGVLWTITRIFILNFDVAGPNPTILLFLLLSTGWILAVCASVDRGLGSVYLLSLPFVGGGFALSLLNSPLAAGVGAVILVTAATVPIIGIFDALRERAVPGIALGLLLTIGLRIGLDTASPYATTGGTMLLAGVLLGALALLGVLGSREALPGTDWTDLGVTPAVPASLLVVAAGFLVHPQALSRWALRSYEFSVLAAVLGIGAGLLLLSLWRVPTGREAAGLIAVFLGSVLGFLYLSHELSTAFYALAWLSALLLLAAGARVETTGRTAGVTAGFQLVALFILFFSIAATHWAFLTFPLDLTAGWGTELTVLFHAVFPLSVAYALFRADTASQRVPTAIQQSRRNALASVGAGIVPLAGLLANRPDPGVAGPREERIRVMAYNLHIFFEEHSSGQYSLGAIRDVMAEDGADIIAVSESDGLRPLPGYVDGLRWLGNELGYYTEFGAETRRRSYGVGFLSRWPIEDVEVIELPIGRSLTRLAVTATIQTPNGALPVLSTHFMVEKEREEDDTRDEQAEAVVDRMTAHDQAVVMGDFNIRPDEPEYDILAEAFEDAWVTAREAGVAHGTDETYSAADPDRRIDYIFLQGEWTVHEAATKGTGRASDHKAIVAEIEPEGPLDS